MLQIDEAVKYFYENCGKINTQQFYQHEEKELENKAIFRTKPLSNPNKCLFELYFFGIQPK